MGFTALDGLPMGTRPGELDPGVVLFLFQGRGMHPDEVADLLYRRSGLLGLSGISSDMRDLLGSEDEGAAFAVEHFVHRAGLVAGQLAAALGGLDAFVFTAGIGENAAPCAPGSPSGWPGSGRSSIRWPMPRGRSASRRRRAGSRSVVRTDEELMIARHTLALVRGRPPARRSVNDDRAGRRSAANMRTPRSLPAGSRGIMQ